MKKTMIKKFQTGSKIPVLSFMILLFMVSMIQRGFAQKGCFSAAKRAFVSLHKADFSIL